MFDPGTIWAYPTDTSFGLGVRCDDVVTLTRLKQLKNRPDEKWFSLMVRDFAMLQEYAEVPEGIDPTWFTETPRTAILKPKNPLPQTGYWPLDKVAFRISTILEVSSQIEVPVTATSANFSGQPAIYTVDQLKENFGDNIEVYAPEPELPTVEPSEIWDFTVHPAVRVR